MPRDNLTSAFTTAYTQASEAERQKKLLMAEILKAAMTNNPSALQPQAINEAMSNARISRSFLPTMQGTKSIQFEGKGDDELIQRPDGTYAPKWMIKQQMAIDAAQKRTETQQTGANKRAGSKAKPMTFQEKQQMAEFTKNLDLRNKMTDKITEKLIEDPKDPIALKMQN